MPKQKDLKRVVRTRMQKTGESYTTARLHVIHRKDEKEAAPKAEPQPTTDYATLAGMSDAAVQKATGCNWKKWVDALDYAGASEWSHREIAEYVHTKFKTPGWWTQTVAVGYERIRGLRDMGQRRGGGYEVSKSKTIGVPLATLYKAFSTARQRSRWLPGVKLTVRTATPEKSMRIRWDDDTAVDVYFTARGDAKSQVAVQHRKLASKPDAERMKAFWAERLDAMATLMKSK